MWIAILGVIGAALGLTGTFVSAGSSKKARKAAENAAEEQTKLLASFAGLSEKETGELQAKRDQLIQRQKYLLTTLMQLILVSGKKRWKDEYNEAEVKLQTEDFATEITNLIHTSFLGGNKYVKKFVEDSRKLTGEFNTNARDLRALNATIDNKLSEEPAGAVEGEENNLAGTIGNFFRTGNLSGPYRNLIIIALTLVVAFVAVKTRKTGKKK